MEQLQILRFLEPVPRIQYIRNHAGMGRQIMLPCQCCVKTLGKIVLEATFTSLTVHLPVTFHEVNGSSF